MIKDSLKNAILKQINNGKFAKCIIFGEGDSAFKIADILSKIDLEYKNHLKTYEKVLGVITARGGSKGIPRKI